ncbi:MAG: septal ring lytic transglycosylase RlpA family protein, partial [Saprospiraceae bacterium]
FGTNLKVTRLDTKKSVIVRVNDRGPFMDGYVVDLSRTAAEKIGLIREGVTKVKIEVVNESAPANVKPLTYSAPTKTLPAHLEPVSYSSTSRVSSASDATTQLVKPVRQNPSGSAVVPATYSTVQGPQALPASPGKATAQVSELYQIELKPVQSRGFGLQMAVLTDSENLFQQIEKLQKIWPGKVIVNHEESALSAKYKLILGPFASKKEAEAQQKKAAGKGYKKTFVVEFE